MEGALRGYGAHAAAQEVLGTSSAQPASRSVLDCSSGSTTGVLAATAALYG